MHFSRLFKIKEGKLEKVKDWFNQLNTQRRDEAIATFEYEQVTREVFVLFQNNTGDSYVIGFNEASGIPGKSDPSVQINKEHTAIKMECLEPISNPGEVLMDLKI